MATTQQATDHLREAHGFNFSQYEATTRGWDSPKAVHDALHEQGASHDHPHADDNRRRYEV